MSDHSRSAIPREQTMPGAINPSMEARPWLRGTVLAVAVFATCWTASVMYWRASASMPSGMAIGQLLLGLPAAILLALWLGNKMLLARSGAAAAPPAMPAAAG